MFISRFENVSSPVWLVSASIDCTTTQTCFSNCYADPNERDDLSSDCNNNFVYINCGKFMHLVIIL